MDPWLSTAIVGVGGAVMTAVVKYLTDKKIDKLTSDVRVLEQKEAECQDARALSDRRLLAALAENSLLRDTLPREMVDGVKTLVTETQKQTKLVEKMATKEDLTTAIKQLMP